MKGSTFKRCACRGDDGRQLGKECPKLRGTRHGYWYYAARVPGQQHPAKKGGFSTQVAAEAALRSLQGKVAAGQDLTAAQQTTGAYLEQWIEGKAGLKADTRDVYRRYIRPTSHRPSAQ